jgi:hypothetical protein
LKANKVNLFVSSVLCVFWYHSPNILDTLHICNISWLRVNSVWGSLYNTWTIVLQVLRSIKLCLYLHWAFCSDIHILTIYIFKAEALQYVPENCGLKFVPSYDTPSQNLLSLARMRQHWCKTTANMKISEFLRVIGHPITGHEGPSGEVEV